MSSERRVLSVDLVVLATGMVPETHFEPPVGYDTHGFVLANCDGGIIGAGCAKRPVDVATAVQDATAGALRAIRSSRGRGVRG